MNFKEMNKTQQSCTWVAHFGQVLAAATFFVALGAQAAIPKNMTAKQAPKPQPIQKLLAGGVVRGGMAAVGSYSVLDLRKSQDLTKGQERFVFDIGDGRGRLSNKKVGYYNISYNSRTQEIVMDFPQLSYLRFSDEELLKKLSGSIYVSRISTTMDPMDRSTTMVIKLKRPIAAEVFDVSAKGNVPAKLVLDMKPLPTKKGTIRK